MSGPGREAPPSSFNPHLRGYVDKVGPPPSNSVEDQVEILENILDIPGDETGLVYM